MRNASSNACVLTILSPIKNGNTGEIAYADEVRNRLQQWNMCRNSPMSKVPQTYLSRYFVLEDVCAQSLPCGDLLDAFFGGMPIFSSSMRKRAFPHEERLKSRYLVFTSNFHGDCDTYLCNMWNAIGSEIQYIWEFCYAFEGVQDADSFLAYMKKCQLNAPVFFAGSTDDSLEEQLKSLYLKQEFTRFALENEGMPAEQLQQAYKDFIQRVEPMNLAGPTWKPGQHSLRHI